ncbi:hypothetical protein, partial [Bathymodiolus platifrons methanotrophic gill symbiont]
NCDLLEKISGTFFGEINSILIRHWIIGVCNLVDRESTKVKGETCENISINLINAQIKKQFDGDKWRKQIEVCAKDSIRIPIKITGIEIMKMIKKGQMFEGDGFIH